MNAIGLDVGTHMLVTAKEESGSITYKDQVDAFFTVESTDQTKSMLETLGVPYIEREDKISVLGEDARKFANMFKSEARRPMQTGSLNKKDLDALEMLTALFGNLLGEGNGEPLVYSCTSTPLGTEMNFDYHKAQIESIIKELGYEPKPIHFYYQH